MEKGGWETGNRSRKTGYRGQETRSRAVRGWRTRTQGTETQDLGQRTVGIEQIRETGDR
jgi:hypothetical protein